MWNYIPDPEWIETEQEVLDVGNYLIKSGLKNGVAFDTETTGLRIDKDYPIMFSLSDGVRRFAMMAEWMHHPIIKDEILGNSSIVKIGTNVKFDKHMAANCGVAINGQFEDTIVLSWLYDENRYAHGLKETALDYCNIKMVDFQEVFPMKKATKHRPADTPKDAILRVLADPEGRKKAIEYSGLDAYASHRVRTYLKERLLSINMAENWTLWNHFQEWEVPFTQILWDMERRGITICTGHLLAQKGPMLKAMEEIEEKIAKMAGWAINIRSVQQLRKLFFEQLGYNVIKMTDGGKSGVKLPSTDEEVLNQFADNNCPFAKLLLEHRGISKAYSTYIEALLDHVDSRSRTHTTLNQAGTVTGRISSRDTNLQNIPRPKTDKFKIRAAFVSELGKILLVADYDQLEMKIMAHFSNDRRMIEAIISGKDLHCFTVSLMFGEDYDEVFAAKEEKKPTERQQFLQLLRQIAKSIGFGLIYGIGAPKLARDLTDVLGREVTEQEAELNIAKYFAAFPDVKRFIDSTHRECHRTEFVQTLVRRFRRLPQINAKGDRRAVSEAERQSVNSIIQGTAADIVKAAMFRAAANESLKSMRCELLLQIHDELIFEMDDNPEEVAQACKIIEEIMSDPFDGIMLQVPLTTSAHPGYTWIEAKG